MKSDKCLPSPRREGKGAQNDGAYAKGVPSNGTQGGASRVGRSGTEPKPKLRCNAMCIVPRRQVAARTRMLRVAARMVPCVALAVFALPVCAQSLEEPVFLPTSDSEEALWQRLRSARKGERWDAVLEGLDEYNRLLKKPQQGLLATQGALAGALRSAVRTIVEDLPPEERQRYGDRLDAVLSSAWSESARDATPAAHRAFRQRVLRDYPEASLAEQAQLELLDDYWLEGRWDDAFRVGTAFLARRDGPEDASAFRVRLRLAELCTLTGRTDCVERHVQALRESVSSGSLSAELGERLETFLARRPAVAATTRRSTRNAMQPHDDASSPTIDFRVGGVLWQRSVSNAQLRPFLQEQSKSAPAGEVFLPFHASSFDDRLAFQHVGGVTLFDQRSGRETWTTSLPSRGPAFAELRAPLVGPSMTIATAKDELHAVDTATGALLWSWRVDPIAAKPFAFELRRAGAESIRWRPEGLQNERAVATAAQEGNNDGVDGVGGGGAGDGPDDEEDVSPPRVTLTAPSFSPAGIVVGIRLRSASESAHYLACLASDGTVVWTRFVGAAQTTDFLGLHGEGSPPLAVAGQVIYLSNHGFAVAVDAIDGAVLWGRRYDRLLAAGVREASRTAERWQPNPILALDNLLILAPQDSPYLIALDAVGALLWRSRREKFSSLLGADDTHCYVAGRQIASIAYAGTEGGRTSWTFSTTPLKFRPFGRGVVTQNVLLVPGRRSLLRLDRENGRLLSRTFWDASGGGGNLLVSGQQLAVATPEAILVYGTRAAEEAKLRQLPKTPEALLERAKFHLKNSELPRGLELLREWTAAAPPAPAPNSPEERLRLDLAELALQLAEQPGNEDHATALLEYRVILERSPRRKVAATIRWAAKLEEDGDIDRALAAIHRGLEFDNPQTEYSPDGVLRVSSEAYLRDRILHLRRSPLVRPGVFDELEAEAHAQFETARQKGTPPAYLEFLRVFPYTRSAPLAYLELYTIYQDRQIASHATRALVEYLRDAQELQGTSTPDQFPKGGIVRSKLLLANLYYQTNRWSEAKALFLDLLEKHVDATVNDVPGMAAEERVADYVKLRLQDPGLRDVDATVKSKLRFPLRMSWRSPADLGDSDKTFLSPLGVAPEGFENVFFTQSITQLECRSTRNGMPRWRVFLDMIPGFRLENEAPRFFRSRLGRRTIRGRFVGESMVLHDEYNVFAIEATSGQVRWHIPFGIDDEERLTRLSERVRGIWPNETGVIVVSSSNLYRISHSGEIVWKQPLKYTPTLHEPSAADDHVVVFSQRPRGIKVHSLESGVEKLFLSDKAGLGGGLAHAPVPVPNDRLLLPFEKELKLFDVRQLRAVWTYKTFPAAAMEEVSFFAEAPNECSVVINRENDWPALVALDLRGGAELWRYEKFPSRTARFSVYRDGNHFFVIHGDVHWHLLALELRPGTTVAKPVVAPLWRDEVKLGTFYSGRSSRQLHIGSDALLFADSTDNSLWVYDKAHGNSRPESAREINRFLVEKRTSASALHNDRLVLLTDGGDCAFGPEFDPGGNIALVPSNDMALQRLDMDRVRRFLDNPGDFDNTTELALDYFRGGDPETAMRLLSTSLLAEDTLLQNDAERLALLRYLLSGLKEEHMKQSVPTISAQRVTHPPAIDGELNDAWNLAGRVRLRSPTEVGAISSPGQTGEWDGAEDLAADLYTGWDDSYFYFVLDVNDDVLHPYDRDAEVWKGDCLLIGLDPTGDGGYRQHGNDQLMTLALTVPKRKKDDKNGQDEEEDPGDPNENEEEEGEDEEERAKPEGKFSVKKKPDDSGAIYEVALPWENFSEAGLSPAKGVSFGLSLLLTDDDTGQGATKTLSLNPCLLLPKSQKNSRLWRYIIPNFFPKVRLE